MSFKEGDGEKKIFKCLEVWYMHMQMLIWESREYPA